MGEGDKKQEKKETNPEVHKGLEGVIVSESKICLIDGMAGRLYYRGYDIADIAENCSFEETIYLMLYEKLPNKKELAWIKKELNAHHSISKNHIEMMRYFCTGMNSMEALRTMVSALACGDKDARKLSLETQLHDGLALVAKFATVVAYYYRIKNGLKLIPPDPKLSYAANFLYMLTGKKPDKISEMAMDQDFVLHAEHGFNASSFACRVTISTLSDMHSALTTGVGTLKGPLHGGAAQGVWEMMKKIGDEKNVEAFVKNALAKHEKIMGYGHRVYKTYDPRAKVLKKTAKKISEEKKNMRWFKIAEKLEIAMAREKDLYPNVDFYSAIVYHNIGLPMDLDSPIFAIGRAPGWVAHAIEQYKDNKLIRPRELYTGGKDLPFIPLAKRK